MSEVRGGGRDELPHIRGQAQWPRWATPRPRSGAAAKRSYPTSEVRGGGQDKLHPTLNQGLHFAGAAVKRYPMSKVRETQVRW